MKLNTEVNLAPIKLREQSKTQQHHSASLLLNIHTDDSAFETLYSDWSKLAHQSNQLICMSPDWAASWWKYFGKHENRSLYIITMYDNEKLLAIFPFYKGVSKIGDLILHERLHLIGSGGSPNEMLGFADDYGISDFLDLIVHPDYKARIAGAFLKMLDSPELSRLQITFNQTREDGFIMQNLYPLLKNTDKKVSAKIIDICYYVNLDEHRNFDDFIKNSKSNARRRFRQTLRANVKENGFEMVEAKNKAEVKSMLNNLIELHQDRWTSLGFPGAFEDDRFKKFFKEISLKAFSEKKLWIKHAVDSQGICAVRMLLLYNNRYYDYMSGFYDESPSSKYRPGIGLLLDLVRDSFKLSIERIELLRGDEGYKHDFAHLNSKNWNITIYETANFKENVMSSILLFFALVHKYVSREKMLLKVQHKKVGMISMVPAYLKFRWTTVKNKVKS